MPNGSALERRCRAVAIAALATTALCLWVPGTTAIAGETKAALDVAAKAPGIQGIAIGFSGAYKAGSWTPLRIDLTLPPEPLAAEAPATAPLAPPKTPSPPAERTPTEISPGAPRYELTVTVPDGEGVPSRFTAVVPAGASARDETAAGGVAAVHMLVRPGRVRGDLDIELRRAGTALATRRFVAQSTVTEPPAGDASLATAKERVATFPAAVDSRPLFVVLGPTSMAADDALLLSGLDAEFRPVVARIDSLADLPRVWFGYEPVAAILMSVDRAAEFAALASDDPRAVALRQWIESGGKLVVCLGERAEAILAAGSALRAIVDVKVDRTVPVRQASGLESFTRSEVAVQFDPASAVRLPVVMASRRVIEAHEGDMPWIVRTWRGFGQVLFFAGDLEKAPFSLWKDRPALVARLLGQPTALVRHETHSATVMHAGYGDMAGQLRSALDQWREVWPISFWTVAAATVFYILLVGPVDFYLVRRWLKRPWLTWISFPLLVVALSVGAVVAAKQAKGSAVRLQQADLIDYDAESGIARATSWAGVFAPRVEAFSIGVHPRAVSAPPIVDRESVAWFGLPGSALGGMNPHGAEAVLWPAGYRFGPELNRLEGLPLAMWSSRSLTARWLGRATAGIEADLTVESQVPVGTIINHLKVPLRQCVLAHQLWAYNLGEIKPGGVAPISIASRRSELKTLLTGRRIIFGKPGEDYRQQATPYDPNSMDPYYVLRIMGLFEAAGGESYTGLSNDYQAFVDLSELLKTNRAVLLAELPEDVAQSAASEWLAADRPLGEGHREARVMMRVVLPVKGISDEQ